MSTFLAISAVSAVLRSLILQSMSSNNLGSILATPLEVSGLPPDRIETGQQSNANRVNLFLFQATENAAWRNRELPSRNGRGERTASPKLALDLHYLLTAHGTTDFSAEVLLGHAMYVFHETPVLTRQAIRDALAALPPTLADALEDVRLADQFEQIKIVPRAAGVEEISKVWTALKSQYRTSAAYDVSVVLIEANRAARSALPVLTRGRPVPGTGRDEGVFVNVGLLPPVPTLESLGLPAGAPAVRLGETLALRGHHLAGNQTRARFRPTRDTGLLELAAGGAGDGGFEVQLPPDPPTGPVAPGSPLNPDNWRAGVYEVTAVMEQGGQLRESNRLPVVLAPRINSVTASVAGGQLSLEVTCSPRVRPTQSVVLVVGTRELRPEPFTLPTGTLTFPAPEPPDVLPSGQQWVRLRVDGVESLLVNYQAAPPAFQASQSVVIP
jgi:Pvc16 N-terminal domain